MNHDRRTTRRRRRLACVRPLLLLSLFICACHGSATNNGEATSTMAAAQLAAPTTPAQPPNTFANSSAQLQLNVLTNSCGASQMQDFFEIVNTGTTPVKLSDLTIKFWADDTSGQNLVPHVWTGGCVTNVNGNPSCVHQVTGVTPTPASFAACGPDPTHQANWEVMISDTDSTLLPPGAIWSNIQTAVNLANYTNFTPGTADWYSGCLTGNAYQPDPNVALYYQGNLVLASGGVYPSCRAPQGNQVVPGDALPAAEATSPLVGPVPPGTVLSLGFELPFQNLPGLVSLMQGQYDPTSPQYQQFLTSTQFASMFSSSSLYQQLIGDLQGLGLQVTATYGNNLFVIVSGPVSAIENAFFVNMNYYGRASGGMYFAPDRVPTTLQALPLATAIGFNNFNLPLNSFTRVPASRPTNTNAGSGPGSTFYGPDFPTLYAGGTTLTGAGQSLALVEFDDYFDGDISTYENLISPPLSTVVPQRVTVGAGPGGVGSDNTEVALDIDMAVAMAPQLKNLYVYEGPGGTDQASFDLNAAAVFNAIADYAKNGQAESNQVSCSWYGFDGSAIVGALVQMNMDGQSVFISSGDNGAYVSTNPIWNFITNEVGVEYPYGSVTPPPLQGDQVCIPTGGTTCFDAVNLMTVVGGTQSASTTGTNTACVSETVWDDTSEIQGVLDGTLVNGGPSGGGISQAKIPTYQPASLMTTTGPNPNNGSTTNRNIPDVAALADAIWTVNSDGQQMASGGTSAATPLWAGFAALVHEQRANATPPLGPIGLLNPYLYNIGPQTAHFTVDFHDILSGTNNPDASDTAHWSAVPGYDLTTGWGTPRLGLISDLASPAPAASPILYDAANFIIQTGNDDLRCTSTATVDLLDVNGNPLQSSITLHSNGQDSWSGGSTHTVSGAVSPPQPATAIAFVRVNFFQGSSLCQIGTTSDNWNIAAITVDLSSSSTGTSRTILLLNFNPQVRLKDHGNGQAWTVTWSAKFACPVGCFEGPSCGVQSDCPSGAGACIGGDGSSGDGSGCCIDTSLACGCNGDCASGNCVGGNGTCGSGGGACE